MGFSQQYPPSPQEMFYKPNLAAVHAAKDVYSPLYSSSLSNYWSCSLELSGDGRKSIDHPSPRGPFVTPGSFWADLG